MTDRTEGIPPHQCRMMRLCLDDDRVPIGYSPSFREYFLWMRQPTPDDFGLTQAIDYCPWCGQQLPSSLSNRWAAELEALLGEDYDTLLDPDSRIPAAYRSDEWWRGRIDEREL